MSTSIVIQVSHAVDGRQKAYFNAHQFSRQHMMTVNTAVDT